MNKKILSLILGVSLSSCSGCNDSQNSTRDAIDCIPQELNFEIINIPYIDENDAKNREFWESYNIDQRLCIEPIKREIQSDTWEQNGALWVMLSGFLAAKPNVGMLNTYKNHTTLNKILFFMAQEINLGQKITKFEDIFYDEFLKRLKNIYPNNYNDILQDPIQLENILQAMVVDDINENNPDSVGKISKYTTRPDTFNTIPIRNMFFLPDPNVLKDYPYDDKYSTYYDIIKLLKNNKDLEQQFIAAQDEYQRTGSINTHPLLHNILLQIFKDKFNDQLLNPPKFQPLQDAIVKIIQERSLKFRNKENIVNSYTNWKDRYCILAKDDSYHVLLGNKNLLYGNLNFNNNDLWKLYDILIGNKKLYDILIGDKYNLYGELNLKENKKNAHANTSALVKQASNF